MYSGKAMGADVLGSSFRGGQSRQNNLDITIMQSSSGMNNQSHLSNKPSFQKMVARHLCQKFNQNEVSNDIFEVYQYPILKTQNSNSQGDDKFLLSMNYKLDK